MPFVTEGMNAINSFELSLCVEETFLESNMFYSETILFAVKFETNIELFIFVETY